MMGNEGSHLSGLEIDERVVEVTDGWTLHSGTVSGGNNPNISVFISEVLSGGGGNAVILERAAKNLMLYRHPCILKFISSWNKSGRIHLATEEVKPLASVLASQTPLQICIGLHSILKALVFLHEKAASSHNNVCCAAIYVTPDGTWKLGGLEYLCRFTDLTPSYLEETRARRYEKAVPPEEDSMKSSTDAIAHPMSIDQYGFGVLVEEVLHKKSDSDIPALQDFREICKKQLQSSEPSLRPKLASLLDHIFFTHKFITIHSFLAELPLKSEADKNDFFRSLMDQLTGFPENLVAMQLGALLLSRMVLLDATAQEILLPRVLCPKQENGENAGLFSLATYKEYVIPRLLQMFCVRDAQIRLLLLAHFSSFCHSFSEEQLRTLVLPELLVGIKDTNEQLVSVTLRALADLVPVLGAAAVIGGKRAKLFTDGRPKARHHISNSLKAPKSPNRVLSTPALALAADTDSTSFAADLPERPSPDGGEDRIPTSDDETEAWSDWDVPDNTVDSLVDDDVPEPVSPQGRVHIEMIPSNKQELDISQLDIKNSVASITSREEFDFFQDMEPVISKTHILQIDEQELDSSDSIQKISKHKFDVNYTAGDGEGDGWGDDLEDWGDVPEGNTPTNV
ncbi:protein-associating with the carboxyl-terminal domain of ezrin [Periplaneta americana]|uniref:protein-associating with the carboxyl-terminal domain of ezrin n=1 Tax=Periplaneta americana TaxID=6978 RepID=UPI0037E74B3D